MKRTITAFLLAGPVLYLIVAAPFWVFWAAVAVVASLCYLEYRALARGHGIAVFGPAGIAAGVLLLLPHIDSGLALALYAALALGYALRSADLKDALPSAAAFLLGLIYVFLFWRFAVLLRILNPHWLVFAMVLNWAGDIAAYYTGRAFGRRKLAPRVSPGKTWAGALGSVMASILFSLIYLGIFLQTVSPVERVVLALCGNAAGQIGDLAESALKRGAGAKDSGTLLPGHGGFLDRVDSTLFTLPVVYALLLALD